MTGAPGLDLPALEVAKVAEAYGVSSQVVSGRDELHSALEGAIRSGAPKLVEVPVAPGMALFIFRSSGLLSSEAGGLPADSPG